MAVNITGPVLSSLLFEHCNADSDREGLLLGSVKTVVTNKISDSDISVVERQILYDIYSFLPCPGLPTWHDNKGAVNADALTKMLHGYDPKEVLGWYKLRRNSSLLVSLKEDAVNRSLSRWLQQLGTGHSMIFMLCVSQSSDTIALHTCDHQFFMCTDSWSYVSLPETIVSLAGVAQASYQFQANDVSSAECTYNRILNKYRSSFTSDSGLPTVVSEINAVRSKLHTKLESLSDTVRDSEAHVARELNEVQMLRLKLAYSQMYDPEAKNPTLLQASHTLPAKLKAEPNQSANTSIRAEPSATLPSSFRVHRQMVANPPVKAESPSLAVAEKDLIIADDAEMKSEDLDLSPEISYPCIDTPELSRHHILDDDDGTVVLTPCLVPKPNANQTNISVRPTLRSERAGRSDIQNKTSSAAIVVDDGCSMELNSDSNVSSEPFDFVHSVMKTYSQPSNRSATLPRNGSGGDKRKSVPKDSLGTMERSQSQQPVGEQSHRKKKGDPMYF